MISYFTNGRKCCTIYGNTIRGGALMYCLKCGREVNEDQDFCSDCVTVMEKYPVKPGTAILLPRRREGAALTRPAVRRKTLTADEQIRKLRRRNRKARC